MARQQTARARHVRAGGVGVLVLVAAVLALSPARAPGLDPWTSTDTAWQLAFAGAMVGDCLQTHSITSDPMRRELNPILGRKPSHARVNAWFAGTLVGHTAAARVLPRPYRRVWQVLWFGIESHAVWRNNRAGVGFSFEW